MDYNIGDQIQRKVLKEQVPVGQVARRIGIERQSLYDIFRSDSIKTSRLMDICKVLNYDFFADLSIVYNSNRDEIVADVNSSYGTELIRGDEISVMRDNYILVQAIIRYLKSESSKPFVVFYASDKKTDVNDIFRHWYATDWGISDENINDVYRDMMSQEWDSVVTKDISAGFTCLEYTGCNYSKAIENSIELMKTPGRHIIMVITVDNKLKAGSSGGLVYEDVADDLFRIWRENTHMVVACSSKSNYMRSRELYKAYCRDGIFDRMSSLLAIDDNIEKQLFDLTVGYGIIQAEELIAPDKSGYSRIRLSYPELNDEEHKLMFENGVNDSPRLDMWIDLRYGVIIDFQYRIPSERKENV